MRIYQGESYQEISRIAAGILCAQAVLSPECVLGLATGGTPVGLYQEMARRCREGEVSFARVRTVNLDEYRGLAPDHDQSYRYFMQTNLFDHIDIKAENTHLLSGLARDPEAECAAYEELIARLGGIDLQLLGIGHNGHIAFNEPADHFPVSTHLVDLTENTIQANARFFQSIDDVPRQALTMGIGTIMRARRILMVVTGEKKADIVCRAFTGPVTPQVPASILQLHPDVTLVGDRDALLKLREAGAEICG